MWPRAEEKERGQDRGLVVPPPEGASSGRRRGASWWRPGYGGRLTDVESGMGPAPPAPVTATR